MIVTLLASLAGLQGGTSSASLHPAEALVFVEMPDVPRLLEAYERAPAVQMARDADVRACVDKLELALGVDLTASFDAVLADLGVPAAKGPRGVATVVGFARMARSASLSIGLHEDSPGELKAAWSRIREVTAELAQIHTALAEWQGPEGSARVSLAELGLSTEVATDPWKHPYVLQHGSDAGEGAAVPSTRVVSLGADGQPGGTGANADIDGTFEAASWLASELPQRASLLVTIEFATPDLAQAGRGLAEVALGCETRGAISDFAWKGSKAELLRFHASKPFEADGWSLRSGALLVLALGAETPEHVAARAAGQGASLAASPELAAFERVAGAAKGAVVARGLIHAETITEFASASDAVPGPAAVLVDPLVKLGKSHVARMQLDGERFVTDVVSSQASDSPLRFLGKHPVDRASLAFVPADAAGVIASAIDGPGAHDQLLELLALAPDAAESRAKLKALEEKHGFDLQHDLFDSLAGSVAIYLMPITALGPPAVTAVVELRDPVAFDKGVRGLVAALQAEASDEIKVKVSKYRDAPLWTFTPAQESGAANPLNPTPTIAIVGKRALICTTSLRAKKEIKRALGEEESAPHALSSSEWKAPAAATLVGSMDWGGMIDAIYKAARAALALGGMVDLPIDTAQISAALPESPQTFTRFFKPTAMWGMPLENGFHLHSEASFGPETWIGLTALGATILKAIETSQSAPPDATEAAAPADSELDATRERLAFLATRLSVFQMDQARFPSELSELCKPTPSFPRGFVESDVLPSDGWGQAFEYRRDADGRAFKLWSIGRDGVDAAGAGDDVLAP